MSNSTPSPLPWWQRLIHLLLQLAGFFVLLITHILVLEQLPKLLNTDFFFQSEIAKLSGEWMLGLVSVFSSAYWLDFFQQRLGFKGLGFTRAKAVQNLGLGLAVGSGIILTCFLILWAGGWVQIRSTNWQTGLFFSWFLFFIIQPLTEEIVMRSVFQTYIHRYFGAQAGLTVSALIFGAMHAGNDSFSWIAGLEIVLGGYLMGQLFLRTQSIWGPFAMHASWNFLQSTVLGFAVSGMGTYSVLQLDISGPNWLTGGNFGLEGSLFSLILLVIVIVYFWPTPETTPWQTELEKKKKNLAQV